MPLATLTDSVLLAQQAGLKPEGWISILVTVLIFVEMQRRRTVSVDMLFLAGLVVVTVTGVLTVEQALSGFANQAVVMIAALFAASAGLRVTGALDWVGNRLLGGATTERGALARLAAAVVPASAFVLNTPLVAMFTPVVVDWCRQRSISPSRLLIPLSYFTIIGGVCTLIGTSTTVVINGLLAQMAGSDEYADVAHRIGELSFFETTLVGVPLALIGTTYMLLIAPRRLPNRTDMVEEFDEHRRDYLVEMHVQPSCPLVSKTVEAAGLRSLPGLFLIEITRGDENITPVSPDDIIRANDQLVFTGVVTTIADLERIPGLVPAVDSTFETRPEQRVRRELTEAVLSRTSPLIGLTVRESNFRKRYNAAVVAVHRNGERLTNKVGNVRLEPGDTLLLQTRNEFVESHRNSRDFYLVSRVGKTTARRHDRAALAGLLFVGLILWLTITSLLPDVVAFGNLTSKSIAAIAVALAMVITRCMTSAEARSAIDLQVLLTIGAALGIGEALDRSDAAEFLAISLVDATAAVGIAAEWKPYALLLIIYLLSQLFTETVTNVAVASIMIKIAVQVAIVGGYDPRPFIIAVTLAASLSFITPIGYQTNLMVMGPGGYQPRDYWRVGWPLALLLTISALVLIPMIWGF
ncbi:MAG: SLC13 family permease [Planctomycetota bacterium]